VFITAHTSVLMTVHSSGIQHNT